jgi:SAM-dependent methyltransferase
LGLAMFSKQVDCGHYDFDTYVKKKRWASLWHQIAEVRKCRADSILEIGPGPGIFKAVARQLGLPVETMDIDAELHPDHIGSATAIPFPSGSYDLVCAFQMLEHLPYEASLKAFSEMVRVSRGKVIVSLPDANRRLRFAIGRRWFFLATPRWRARRHAFNGEHYWEVGKRGYSLRKVIADFGQFAELEYTYRVDENPRHRFFVFRRRGGSRTSQFGGFSSAGLDDDAVLEVETRQSQCH